MSEQRDTECPAFLEPRLRLYLSADIIGSTAQKQSRLGALESSDGSSSASWFTTIQGFYFEAQQSFKATWDDLRAQYPDDDHFGEAPLLWKTVGDEVIFTKLLTDHRQVAVVLQCWVKALGLIRNFLTRDNARLGIKSTVWMAGFPFRNKEVVLSGESFSSQAPIDDYYKENGLILNRYYSKENKERILLDYVGPSIDTGFRLTALSSARKLILSIEVAYVLALTAPVKASPIEAISLRYEGQFNLKGVLGGAGYPVFWIDLSQPSSADSREDMLTKLGVLDRDAVREYCDAFFMENADLIFPPFIQSASELVISEKPAWYEHQHQILIKNFRASLTPPPEPPPPPEEVPNYPQRLISFSELMKEFATDNSYDELIKKALGGSKASPKDDRS